MENLCTIFDCVIAQEMHKPDNTGLFNLAKNKGVL